MTQNPTTQYATDAKLAKRQRLWTESPRDLDFDLYPWVLDLAFDVVLAAHMLNHVPDRVAASIELRRVLRAGGIGVVVTDLDAFTDYVVSIDDHYEAEVGVPWADVVGRARVLAAEAMALSGELRLTTSVGAFVCR